MLTKSKASFQVNVILSVTAFVLVRWITRNGSLQSRWISDAESETRYTSVVACRADGLAAQRAKRNTRAWNATTSCRLTEWQFHDVVSV